MIRLPEIKTAELSTYGNLPSVTRPMHFRVSSVGLGTRLVITWKGRVITWEGGVIPLEGG